MIMFCLTCKKIGMGIFFIFEIFLIEVVMVAQINKNIYISYYCHTIKKIC